MELNLKYSNYRYMTTESHLYLAQHLPFLRLVQFQIQVFTTYFQSNIN